MHLSPKWLRLLSVLRRWPCCCGIFVYCFSLCLLGFCFRPLFLLCRLSIFAVILARKDSRLLYLNCLHGVCSLVLPHSTEGCLRYFLILLTYFYLMYSIEETPLQCVFFIRTVFSSIKTGFSCGGGGGGSGSL